ncbi:DUF429 domain-containing protein [Synechococcales cyanobacterium C]|uniref:DUF429 domain-containing protein n=1 Tax=Petrachloros mirabilis ULC683 TaxID=2781853 RepID=A0A8K2A1P3_9CYAN|nr:DUF429 domain-containing protein [Petrachloros mirabilis]NCJ07862.1 DUF429 domain-containing protein [Petrachloros mirabilis ULC683]
MRFLGIDLGWSSGASGVCCLSWEQETLKLLNLERRLDATAVLAWVDHWLPIPMPGLVAVDAPTRITNPTGMRRCDRDAHRRFGRYHAGCYPANLSSSFAPHTTSFGHQLEARGFSHGPDLVAQQAGRYQIEVFPHAAMISLFELPRILKYKKGRLSHRRPELEKLRHLLQTRLCQLKPALQPLDLPPVPMGGSALKDLEDRLDSLLCAYVGAYYWWWGCDRNWVLGHPHPEQASPEPAPAGYIVVPALPGWDPQHQKAP